MTEYYFLMTSLPKLVFGMKPEISIQELNDLLMLNLTPDDQSRVKVLRLYADLYNMRAFWKGMPLDPRGNLTEKELDEAILVKDFLPAYVLGYLDKYESREERLQNFSELLAKFFCAEIESESGFLKDYFSFEREYRLFLTFLRARKLRRDLSHELINEDPQEYFISSLLALGLQENSLLPEEYAPLGVVFEKNYHEPKELDFCLNEFRFKAISSMTYEEGFGIDQLLRYLALFQIVDDMASYDMSTGVELLEALFKG